jgi:hypothetical protein
LQMKLLHWMAGSKLLGSSLVLAPIGFKGVVIAIGGGYWYTQWKLLRYWKASIVPNSLAQKAQPQCAKTHSLLSKKITAKSTLPLWSYPILESPQVRNKTLDLYLLGLPPPPILTSVVKATNPRHCQPLSMFFELLHNYFSQADYLH